MDGTTATIAALIPILWLLLSLGALRMPSHLACPAGLLASLAVAAGIAGMAPALALKAALEGVLFALLPILWVIVAAFFAYNVTVKTGAIDRIRLLLSGLSDDRRIQVLLIAWGFGGFMESVAGFGTAVAVPAALLTALGFPPFKAALVCLLANTVSVAFGVVGIPLTTLARITELPISALSQAVVVQLTAFALILPALLVAVVSGGPGGLKGVRAAAAAAGFSYAIVQYLTARYVGPELAAVTASVASFSAVVAVVKLRPSPRPEPKTGLASPGIELRSQLAAWSPYILLLVVVLGSSRLVPPVNALFSRAALSLPVYDGPGGKPLRFEWLLTPGTAVFVSAAVGGLIQGATLSRLAGILGETAAQLRRTAVTVASIVGMAKVLSYGGLVGALAASAAALAGSAYPFFSPWIGALGTFLTGSDTSANILFGALQKQTAIRLGLDPVWIAASNTSGACVGKLLSPQSLAVAVAATGLAGREGELLSRTLRYAVVFLAALGALTWALAR